MMGNEETVKDCLPKKVRSKKCRKKRFKEGKRDFRKPHKQFFCKSFHLLRYAATELYTKELGQDRSLGEGEKAVVRFFSKNCSFVLLYLYVCMYVCKHTLMHILLPGW